MRLATDENLLEFRREFEAWLDAHLPGPDVVEQEHRNSSAHLPGWAREWQRTLFEAGWLVPGWPPELGGRNATPHEQMIYFEEISRAADPAHRSTRRASASSPPSIARLRHRRAEGALPPPDAQGPRSRGASA